MATIANGFDNPFYLDFTFEPLDPTEKFDLKTFDRVAVSYGEQTWDTLTHPNEIKLMMGDDGQWTVMRLSLGRLVTTKQSHYLVIVGYSSRYPNGFKLSDRCAGNLTPIHMCR